MNLQVAYNIVSSLWIGYCIYKIHLLESTINVFKNSIFINSLSNLVLTKMLIDKEIVTENELNEALNKVDGKEA